MSSEKAPAPFVHLHLHTQYSLLDGAVRIPELVKRAKELGMPAVAITDHGSMMGAVELFEKTKGSGVKPIVGCEVYVAKHSMRDRGRGDGEGGHHHLVLIAETNEGYKNLVRIVSASHRDGFYYKPRCDKDLLRANSKGLIALSACLHGEVAAALSSGNEHAAEAVVRQYKEIFPGSFYLEVQANGMSEQIEANAKIIGLARRTDTPLVATNDCHYLRKEDHKVHDILLCLQTGVKVSDADRMRFPTDQFYLKSGDEFLAAFPECPDAVENTVRIAERCNVTMELGKYRIPEFPIPDGKTPDEYLGEVARMGLSERFGERDAAGAPVPEDKKDLYRERLEYELSVIFRMGFSGYFLIVWDYIRFARGAKIPVGPGRGSGAGSLAAYSLRITNIDPIPHGLLFERFLNPERVSLPDVDTDFCKDRREEVIEYIKDRFGRERVAQIIALGTMKTRQAIRDVARVLDMPYTEADRLAKLVPGTLGMTLALAPEKEPKLKELLAKDERAAEVYGYARRLEGMVRHASVHPAGVVIANGEVGDEVPLFRQSDGSITTQFHMKDAEKAGLVKFDILGLKTLTVIDHAVRMVRERHGTEIDVDNLPLDDAATYRLYQAGDTDGVFQSEGGGFTGLLMRLRPERFEHLVDMMALYRPGPLQSGMMDDFIERRHGRKQVEYILPEMECALHSTYGVMVYQEQVMQISNILAGFSLGEADTLRKAIGKKDHDLMAKQKDKFIKGAVAKGHPEATVKYIFELMEQFGEYGFNKSHSAAYAMISYQTALLKAHYPVEFMCALLTSEAGNTDNMIRYISHCKKKGIRILPPDVNESSKDFTPAGDAIRFGLSAIKGVGEAALEAVERARKDGPFRSVDDFLSRVEARKVNRRVCESLIRAGAFDSVDSGRARIFDEIGNMIEDAAESAREREIGQFSLFGGTAKKPKRGGGSNREWSKKELLAHEKDTVGFYVTGHPLDEYASMLAEAVTAKTSDIEGMAPGEYVRIGGVKHDLTEKTNSRGQKFAFFGLEDLAGTVRVVVFANLYKQTRELIVSGDPVLVVGRIDDDEKRKSVIAEEIMPLSEGKKRMSEAAWISFDGPSYEKAGEGAGIKGLIATHRGGTPLYLKIVTNGKEHIVSMPRAYNVSGSKEFVADVERRFGKGSCWIGVAPAATESEGRAASA